MACLHVVISVRGFTETEARRGLPTWLGEFQQWPWLFRPSVGWEVARGCLEIGIDYEGHDLKLCGQAVLDEVWDCVIACLQTVSDLHFEIDDSKFIPAT